MKIFRFALVTMLTLFCCHPAKATIYYVDSNKGDDANTGSSATAPWKSLDKINHGSFRPGDRILLHAGSQWRGELAPPSSGTPQAPILIDRYGKGSLPLIAGEGHVESVLALVNVEYIEVRHLEITNKGENPAVRRGVLLEARNFGTAHHIVVGDLFIHDVNGTNAMKNTGGILFRTEGKEKPSRFDDLLIERNILWKVDRSALSAESFHWPRTRWFPSLRVVIRENYAEDVGGDGIVPWATDGAIVEYNTVLRANQRAKTFNAGIWPWSADNSLFQFNEAGYVKGTQDGEGFDSDYNSRNTRFRFNYSHDNEGGFLLVCTPVKRNQQENIGNIGTVAEYNISRNDHARLINLSGAEHTRIENNIFYTPPGEEMQLLLLSEWDGWPKDILYRRNTHFIGGSGVFGHEASREASGLYHIASGWGEVSGVRLEGNRYYGRLLNPPWEEDSIQENVIPADTQEWQEPQFSPTKPEEFASFLKAHRAWIRSLFSKHFPKAMERERQ